jgi:transcriptional regulator with XRE-family HTH domain
VLLVAEDSLEDEVGLGVGEERSRHGKDLPQIEAPGDVETPTRGVTVATDERVVAIGREVRRRRMALGWTLDASADVAGLTPNFIGGVENGRRNLSLTSMARIAKGLGVNLADLLGMPELSPEAIGAARLLRFRTYPLQPTGAQGPLAPSWPRPCRLRTLASVNPPPRRGAARASRLACAR